MILLVKLLKAGIFIYFLNKTPCF